MQPIAFLEKYRRCTTFFIFLKSWFSKKTTFCVKRQHFAQKRQHFAQKRQHFAQSMIVQKRVF